MGKGLRKEIKERNKEKKEENKNLKLFITGDIV